MLELKLPEHIADELLDILNEIIVRAKDAGPSQSGIIVYLAPIMAVYAEALAKAKPRRRSPPLIKLKQRRKSK